MFSFFGSKDSFQQRIELLKRFHLSSALESHLAEHMEGREWKPGEVVTEEGDEGGSMFFINSGNLVVKKKNHDGDNVKIAEMNAGDFFGEIAMLKGNLRSSTVVIEKQSYLYELKWEDIKFLVKSKPELDKQLRDALAQRDENDKQKLI